MQFEFLQNADKKDTDWFLLIDSRQYEISINIENVEEFSETKDKKLFLVYYLPDEKSPEKFIRKSDTFDCCENGLILKTFGSIYKQIYQKFGGEDKFLKRIEGLLEMQDKKKIKALKF